MDPDGDYESLHSARSHGTIFKNAKLDDADWKGKDEELGLQPSPKINSSKVVLAEEKGATCSIGTGPSAPPADDLGCLPSAPPLELLSLHPSPEDDATAPPTPESSHPPEPPGFKEEVNKAGNYIPDSIALPIGLDNADRALPVASVVPIITDATGAEITPPPAQPEVSPRTENDSANAPTQQQSTTRHGSRTTQTTADNRAPTRRVPPFFPEATLADLQPPREERDKGGTQECKCTPCKELIAVAAFVIAIIAAVGIGLTLSDGPDDPDDPAINARNTKYPNCHVAHLSWLNDGRCDRGLYDKEECDWDGGDCLFDNYSHMECTGRIGSTWTDRTRAWCQIKCMEQGITCEAYDFSGGTCRTFGSYSSTTNKSNSKCFAKQDIQPDIVDSYPTCNVPNRNKINDGSCDGGLYNNEECGWDGGDCIIQSYPDCHVDNPAYVGDNDCDGDNYNTEACGWDGGDCIVEDYPDCHGIHNPHWIGDGSCDGGKYNTRECGWDGGDCLSNANCHVDNPEWIGDGFCNGGGYNTVQCAWDGGDCIVEGYPDCHVVRPQWIGDSNCDRGEYNTEECGWDGGDCLSNCQVDNPDWIGDGFCNGGGYNTAQCAWDGGDCVVDGYPDCHVVRPLKIGDGNCDGGEYNSEECGWDGGDCDNEKKDEYSVAALYPNCNARNKQWLNDGMCDGSSYNNAECGYDGGDCLFNKNNGKACVGSVRSTWTDETRLWCQFKCLEEGNQCKAYDFDSTTDTCRIFSSYSSKTSRSTSKCYKKK